ncbi:hypothetical protein MSG28_001107 [Choristoneura fumiferana]|uniref:Uncharacterized protein n=1 Tax=Choristoneura fumiferana TaxID=7141 RepID=A0ACC0K3H8_CHOFU|nr:hypothetical protein MSG28_001107 [Choristoneura fumiferana]
MSNKNVKQTLDNLAELFNSKMAEFQGNLDKADTRNPTVTSVAADFNAFKSFISNALECLQQQVACLTRQVDQIEARSRRKMLLFHGVPEVEDEDTVKLAVDVCKLRVKCDMSAADVSRCLRTGRSQSSRRRPILVHFNDVALRDKVWFAKTALRGSGIVISEFLTHPRHAAFMAARERFGVDKCWTREGVIVVLDGDGGRHRVTSLAELEKIPTGMSGTAGLAGTPHEEGRYIINKERSPIEAECDAIATARLATVAKGWRGSEALRKRAASAPGRPTDLRIRVYCRHNGLATVAKGWRGSEALRKRAASAPGRPTDLSIRVYCRHNGLVATAQRGAGTGGAATSPDGGSNSAPPLSPGGSAVAGGALSPGAGSHASTPAASCCDTPRPIITDPVTGQTVCSCQYDGARLALSSYPRLSSAAVGVYGTPYPSTDQNPYPSIGVDSSAFYSPLKKESRNSIKEGDEARHEMRGRRAHDREGKINKSEEESGELRIAIKSNPYALKEGGGEMSAWTSAGLQPSGGYYPYDPTLAAYGCGVLARAAAVRVDARGKCRRNHSRPLHLSFRRKTNPGE